MSDQTPQVATSGKHFLRSVSLVAWSFLGVRSNKGYQQDLARVNPLHVVFVGLVGVLVLVGCLIALVNWIVVK